jgi:ABC-type transport system involved in multi-copper enzyme maturation permease subunit
MGRLFAAEYRKLRTMLQIWLLGAGGILLVAFFTVLILALATFSSDNAETGIPPLDTDDGVRTVIGQTSSILGFVFVLGVLVITSEYRHQTITGAFLAEPRRGRVVAAKFGTAGALGLVIAAVSAIVVVAIALVWLAVRDISINDTTRLVALPAIGSVIAGIGYALLGVALGALVRNQIAAIVAGLLWVSLVDPLIGAFLPDVGKYTPAGAAAALTNAVGFSTSGTDPNAYLQWWAGGLLLLGYALVLTVVAARTTVTRDIT